jgi:hypothetical protein
MKVIKGMTVEGKDALKFVLEQVSPTDTKTIVTVADLRVIDKICKVIETSGDTVELEDADFDFLKRKFDSFPSWNPQARQLVIETSDKLNGAT